MNTQPVSRKIYFGMGSNIDPQANVDKALVLLEQVFGRLWISPLYSGSALGFDGDDFLNLVGCSEFSGNLIDLRDLLQGVEYDCGRRRLTEHGKGARTMDLDLLLFGELQGNHEGMVLPRPDVYERAFVRRPMLDLLECAEQPLSEFEQSLIPELRRSEQLHGNGDLRRLDWVHRSD